MNNLSQFSLAGKRALITGSSRGIGYALAGALASAGADIILNARDTEALGKAAASLAKSGVNARAVAFDVTSSDSIIEAVDHVESEIGPIDILINNAGMQFRAPLEDFPEDRFERLMATNVNSVFLVGQTVARRMIRRGTGKIINICSLMSTMSRPTIAPYAASKAAVANLTRGMATEWAPHGLNVNGIAPGYFRTELNEALFNDPAFTSWVEKRTPMGRWGETEELGGAAIFLASDAARFVNGHILYVDGALTATILAVAVSLQPTHILVVMGVTSSGKTVTGEAIARRLHAPFFDGDDLHPEANKEKMRSGIPLTDDDRWPWLKALADALREAAAHKGVAVGACSALKRAYRDYLIAQAGEPILFVFLEGSPELIAARAAARQHEFMPASLLPSQLATLQVPTHEENVLTVRISPPVEAIADRVVKAVPHLKSFRRKQ